MGQLRLYVCKGTTKQGITILARSGTPEEPNICDTRGTKSSLRSARHSTPVFQRQQLVNLKPEPEPEPQPPEPQLDLRNSQREAQHEGLPAGATAAVAVATAAALATEFTIHVGTMLCFLWRNNHDHMCMMPFIHGCIDATQSRDP